MVLRRCPAGVDLGRYSVQAATADPDAALERRNLIPMVGPYQYDRSFLTVNRKNAHYHAAHPA